MHYGIAEALLMLRHLRKPSRNMSGGGCARLSSDCALWWPISETKPAGLTTSHLKRLSSVGAHVICVLAGMTASILTCMSTPAWADLIDCAIVEERWDRTDATTPFAERVQIYRQAHYDSTCASTVVSRIGLDIIDEELGQVQAVFQAGGDDAQRRALLARLDSLREFGDHWQLSFLRGELLRSQKDVTGALVAYQNALLIVDDEERTVEAPSGKDIARLRDRLDEVAVVAAQVAPSSLKLPVTRSGDVISQYGFSTRGFTREKVLVPIQFIYAQDVMTENGRTTFKDAFEALNNQGEPDILIIGHTDPDGSQAYNLQLSMERAKAVRFALLDRGYSGVIAVDGKGENEPFRFDDPGLYPLDVRNQAHRRVELVLRGN